MVLGLIAAREGWTRAHHRELVCCFERARISISRSQTKDKHMNQFVSRSGLWLISLGALVTALIASVKATALDQRWANPTPVAVVDWLKATDKVDEWAQMQTSLKQLRDQFVEEDNAWQTKLAELREGAGALPPDSPVRLQEEDKYVLQELQYRSWAQFRDAKLQQEQARMQVQLYLSIDKAVAKVAQRDGWSLVIWNDSSSKKPKGKDLASAAEMISRRQVLYAETATIDITDEVITLMNNEFQAGGSRP